MSHLKKQRKLKKITKNTQIDLWAAVVVSWWIFLALRNPERMLFREGFNEKSCKEVKSRIRVVGKPYVDVVLFLILGFVLCLGSQNLTQMSIFDLKIFNLPLNNYSSFDQAPFLLSFPFYKSEIRPFFKILRSF